MGDTLKQMYVVIGCKTDGYQKGMASIRKDMQSFAQEGLVAGLAITAGMTASVKAWADAGHAIEELSQKTGMSATSISELKYAADLSGSSIDELAVGMKRMAVVVTDAANGSQVEITALKNLGINIQDIVGKAPEVQFNMLLDAIANIADPTEKAAAAVAMFGRSGTDMLPMLADGKTGLDAMKQAANDMGQVFDDKAAKAADNFHTQMVNLGKSTDALKFSVAEGLVPALTPLIDKLTGFVTGLANVTKESPGLVEFVAGLGAFLVVGSSLILMLPKLISGMSGLGGILKMLPGLGSLSSLQAGGLGDLGMTGVTLIAAGMAGFAYNAKVKSDANDAKNLSQYTNMTVDERKVLLKQLQEAGYTAENSKDVSELLSLNSEAPYIQSHMAIAGNQGTMNAQNLTDVSFQLATFQQQIGASNQEWSKNAQLAQQYLQDVLNGKTLENAAMDEFVNKTILASSSLDKLADSSVQLVDQNKANISILQNLFSGLGADFGFMRDAQGNITGPATTRGETTQDLINMSPFKPGEKSYSDPAMTDIIKNWMAVNPTKGISDWAFSHFNSAQDATDWQAQHAVDWGSYQSISEQLSNGIKVDLTFDGQSFGTAVAKVSGLSVLQAMRMGG